MTTGRRSSIWTRGRGSASARDGKIAGIADPGRSSHARPMRMNRSRTRPSGCILRAYSRSAQSVFSSMCSVGTVRIPPPVRSILPVTPAAIMASRPIAAKDSRVRLHGPYRPGSSRTAPLVATVGPGCSAITGSVRYGLGNRSRCVNTHARVLTGGSSYPAGAVSSIRDLRRAMCWGMVPQQPPTMRAPAVTHRATWSR